MDNKQLAWERLKKELGRKPDKAQTAPKAKKPPVKNPIWVLPKPVPET
jgi:hypothetical protein